MRLRKQAIKRPSRAMLIWWKVEDVAVVALFIVAFALVLCLAFEKGFL